MHAAVAYLICRLIIGNDSKQMGLLTVIHSICPFLSSQSDIPRWRPATDCLLHNRHATSPAVTAR